MTDRSSPALGIDLGTTRTVVVAADRGSYPVASFDEGGSFCDHLPALAVHSQGRWWFGEAARARVVGDADDHWATPSVKRTVSTLAPEAALPGGPASTTAMGLLEAYLRWVADMVRTRSNLEIPEDAPLTAMVAVPANASTRQRYLTLEAFSRAGFSVTGMVGEPTAAAVEYAHREPVALSARSPKRYVVVYDLGGGTFDTAAVSLDGSRFSLLTSEGIERLGGADFDEEILELAFTGLVEQGFEFATTTTVEHLDASTRAAMLELCRDAKEGLRPGSRRLLLDFGSVLPDAPAVVLTTDTLYGRCRPHIDRTIAMVDRVLESLPQHGLDPSDPKQLGALYLVGGSVALPPVARALRERYGRKIKLSAQPHAATALGLAVAADPSARIRIREATTRHFGVWREALDGREKVFDPILSKDTLPPSEGEPLVVERRYRPMHTVGHLRFLECSRLADDGRPAGDLTPWRQLRVPYDGADDSDDHAAEHRPVERTTAEGDEIVETYTHTQDGTITVEIANAAAAFRRRYVLGAMR
ncbi:MAG: Hsp70 family protein [Deltaproteobacteria bacterium]|nr:Hsp70 family protein [Deltaproteobacteria bacterium]